jgi:hypothetical protein
MRQEALDRLAEVAKLRFGNTSNMMKAVIHLHLFTQSHF